MASLGGSDLQTVVFAGPSVPQETIAAALPDALIAPPVRRGDLYRYRLLNFSVFIILDGIFANALAVSPREVVDTLRDGAAVIGAASMGALRAADCAPAGALGYGRIYRLFRRRILSSEDEVAVATFPEPPFASLSQSLVDMRFALRMACRKAILSPRDAERLVRAAMDMPYQHRSWPRVAASAKIALSPEQTAHLESRSVKRIDAVGCCRHVAKLLQNDGLVAGPRSDRSAPLGALFHVRERGWDPLDGEDPDTIRPGFLHWLWASAKGRPLIGSRRFDAIRERSGLAVLDAMIDLQSPPGELAALLMQFAGHRRSLAAAGDIPVSAEDTALAGAEIARAHGKDSWKSVRNHLQKGSPLAGILEEYMLARAMVLAFRKSALFAGSQTPTIPVPAWKRTSFTG